MGALVGSLFREGGPPNAPLESRLVQVAITCKHGQLSPNQQEYMSRKSEKLLTYFERVTAINVTVTFERVRVRTEILVDAEHKHNFVANEVGDELIPTFDVTLHKMEQQIRKYKEKIQDHRRAAPEREIREEGVESDE
jgi:putative sigma-54 modulation protein